MQVKPTYEYCDIKTRQVVRVFAPEVSTGKILLTYNKPLYPHEGGLRFVREVK